MADNSPVSAVKDIKDKSVNLLSLGVVRRDGSITPFKADKISNAIKKAFGFRITKQVLQFKL